MSKISKRIFIRKSRKAYICDFCNKLIPCGSSYVKFRGKSEIMPVFNTDRRHLQCTPEYQVSPKCDECGGGLSLPEKDGYLHCTC